MELKESKIGSYLALHLSGRLDTSNYGELEKKLVAFIDGGEKMIAIDCSNMVYISSSGLRVFLMALKKTSAIGGKLVLCGLQDNIREIFEIAGFTAIFTIFNTLEEAVK
jgi:anti-anti-sigma factor